MVNRYTIGVVILLSLFMITLVTAEEFGYGSTKELKTNYSLVPTINNTEHFGGYTVATFVTYLNGIYCELVGCSMTGDIDMGNNNLTDVGTINLTDGVGSVAINGATEIKPSDGTAGIHNTDNIKYIGWDVSGNAYDEMMMTCWNGSNNICRFEGDIVADENITADDIIIPIMTGNNGPFSINHWFKDMTSAGRLTGGTITNPAGTNIVVETGEGLARVLDDDHSQVVYITWTESGNINVPTNSIMYFGVDYNGGTPIVVNTTLESDFDLDTSFPLGQAINQAGEVYIMQNPWWIGDGLTNIIERLEAEGHLERDDEVGGLIISQTGTRNLAMSEGTIWSRLTEHELPAFDSSGADDFDTYCRDGAGGYDEIDDVSQYNVSHYDDNSGILQPIPNNQYAVLWVWANVASEKPSIIYPQQTYPNSASAEAEEVPSTFPAMWYKGGIIIGRIIIKEGVDAPVEVQTVFTTTFTAAQAADHGNLAGLTDDDHADYWSSAVERTLNYNTTGNVTADTYFGDMVGDSVIATIVNATLLISDGLANQNGSVFFDLSEDGVIKPFMSQDISLGGQEGDEFYNAFFSGNVSADYFVGDGSKLTNIISSVNNTNINITSLEVQNNITADTYFGNGANITNIFVDHIGEKTAGHKVVFDSEMIGKWGRFFTDYDEITYTQLTSDVFFPSIDDAIDLGADSPPWGTQRWKDLYLSGNANIDGNFTGSNVNVSGINTAGGDVNFFKDLYLDGSTDGSKAIIHNKREGDTGEMFVDKYGRFQIYSPNNQVYFTGDIGVLVESFSFDGSNMYTSGWIQQMKPNSNNVGEMQNDRGRFEIFLNNETSVYFDSDPDKDPNIAYFDDLNITTTGWMIADDFLSTSPVLDKKGKDALDYFTTTSEERTGTDGKYNHTNKDDVDLLYVDIVREECDVIEEYNDLGEVTKYQEVNCVEIHTPAKRNGLLSELQRDAIKELNDEDISLRAENEILKESICTLDNCNNKFDWCGCPTL